MPRMEQWKAGALDVCVEECERRKRKKRRKKKKLCALDDQKPTFKFYCQNNILNEYFGNKIIYFVCFSSYIGDFNVFNTKLGILNHLTLERLGFSVVRAPESPEICENRILSIEIRWPFPSKHKPCVKLLLN